MREVVNQADPENAPASHGAASFPQIHHRAVSHHSLENTPEGKVKELPCDLVFELFCKVHAL